MKASIATASIDSQFTLENLKALRTDIPFVHRFDMVIRSDLEERFKREIPPVPEVTEIFGIKVYVKPGQIMSAWLISDPFIQARYLNGSLTELDLVHMLGGCHGIAAVQNQPENPRESALSAEKPLRLRASVAKKMASIP